MPDPQDKGIIPIETDLDSHPGAGDGTPWRPDRRGTTATAHGEPADAPADQLDSFGFSPITRRAVVTQNQKSLDSHPGTENCAARHQDNDGTTATDRGKPTGAATSQPDRFGFSPLTRGAVVAQNQAGTQCSQKVESAGNAATSGGITNKEGSQRSQLQPKRLIRELADLQASSQTLDGQFWQAEAHVTQIIMNTADEMFIPDDKPMMEDNMAHIYSAETRQVRPQAAKRDCRPEDLTTNKTAYPTDLIKATEVTIPRGYEDAVYTNNHRDYFIAAIKDEIDAQREKGTVTEVPIGNLPENINLINGIWRFDTKVNPTDGTVRRFKARFCARGDMQIEGVDYYETSSPVVSYTTLRIVLALACMYGWMILSMDISTAFLNADIDEDVFMTPGKGFGHKPGHVWKLLKGLYGTCQAGRAWWIHFDNWIKSDPECRPCTVDPCVYVYTCTNNQLLFVILMLYVDDIISVSNCDKYHHEVQARFSKEYKVTGGDEFTHGLGLQCTRDLEKGTLELHQTRYLMDILDRFDPDSTTTAPTPEVDGVIICSSDCPAQGSAEQIHMKDKPYRAALGCLHFATKTRPDIQHPVAKCSSVASNPGVKHWKAIMRIFHYLRGSIKKRLTYRKHRKMIMMSNSSVKKAVKEAKAAEKLITLVDADHARCPTTRKSQSGWLHMIAGAAGAWGSKSQTVTALSSTEAEYIALASACAELMAIRNLLTQLPVPKEVFDTWMVLEDNQACIKMATNPRGWKRTKHIDVRHHFVRDLVSAGIIDLKGVPTVDQSADMLTKPTTGKSFYKHRDFMLGLDVVADTGTSFSDQEIN